MQSFWVSCPKCGYPHFIKRYTKTELRNFPAYCKGCKKEINITLKSREPSKSVQLV
ncbi:MAG: hypothetical protein IJ833_01200 [Lachnospiraceae bacterium]|nr:hypothetical protein [Lachnospiraceae bacterium]